MVRVSTDWNPIQAEFRAVLSDVNRDVSSFDGAVKLCLQLRTLVHAAKSHARRNSRASASRYWTRATP